MAVRVLKVGSLVLAVLGLGVLYLAATHSQVPVVKTGNLSGTMNWAYVCIEGVVTRQPTYDAGSGTLKFWVGDGTGEIMVTAYSPEAEWLVDKGHVPVMGDHITVEGTLRVREDFEYLILNVPERVDIRSGEPVEMAIAEVDVGSRYQKVTVRGMIRDDRTPYEGLRILTLRDATGEIDVALPSGVVALGGELPGLGVGQSVQVTGAVDEYKEAPQISVGRASDVIVLNEAIAIAPTRRIGEIVAETVGSMAVVEGTIVKTTPFSAGVKFTLDDGSGTVTLLLWQELYASLAARDALVEGTIVRVQGEVAEYRGELEIVPLLPTDVEVIGTVQVAMITPTIPSEAAAEVTAAPTPVPTVPSIASSTPPPTPTPVPTIPSIASSTPPPTPTPVPTVPSIVSSTPPPTPTPTVETRSIGSISGGDLGAILTIARAEISDLSYFSKGVKYRLTDGSGDVTLLVWQNVMEEIPDRYDLVPGSQVQVTGEIDEYQGDLEIIPGKSADVMVISRADRPPIEARVVSSVTASDEGRVFTVEGVVTRTESGGWLKVWLQDGTGEMLVFVPSRVVEYLPAGMAAGVRLRVTGEVEIYQGMVEIIPLAGADVEVR